ncbi:MAG: F0F1 ATP synthase subunit gamma, partial [Candidatus Roizmanbacteria bacterium]|nr:F0F1 ATP synthase subunit gamma [Candidatus Roizmanbacteria bacterium]
MSDTAASLRRKIASAGDLQSVVRTMKALAAANIGQYEQSARALAGYYRSIELGLGVCFRHGNPAVWLENGNAQADAANSTAVCAIVFGTDQGLVGRFNEVVAEHA